MSDQRNNDIYTLNAGELDAKLRQWTRAQIIADPEKYVLFKEGQHIIEDGVEYVTTQAAPTSLEHFKYADQTARDTADAVDVDNNQDKIVIRDGSYNILATFDENGLNIKVINLKDGSGNTTHTINKSWIDLVTAGIAEAGAAKTSIDTLKQSVQVTSEDDKIRFRDAMYNVIAFFDAIGLNVNNIVGKGDGWRFMDNQTPQNVIAKIDSNGLQARLLDKNGNEVLAGAASWLAGKEFFVIGDSLSSSNYWQIKLAELTGAVYDITKNNHATYPLSVGGTRTGYPTDTCGQWRAVNMQRQGITNPYMIVLQNINDISPAEFTPGTKADFPFMLLQLYDYGTIYADYASVPALSVAMLQSVAAEDRKIGTTFRLPYYSSDTKNLEITGVASADGDITITVGGTPYNVAVLTTDTIADIIDKILEIDYVGYTDILNANAVSVDFTEAGAATVVFDGGATGVTASVTDGESVIQYKSYSFMSKDVATDWETVAKWTWYANMTLWSYYKGLIEWLQTTYPEAILAFMSPKRISVAWNPATAGYDAALWYPDGSPNMSAYEASAGYINNEALVTIQKELCQLYDILHFDVDGLSGINFINIQTFHSEANVHPKVPEGYDNYAETIFNNYL